MLAGSFYSCGRLIFCAGVRLGACEGLRYLSDIGARAGGLSRTGCRIWFSRASYSSSTFRRFSAWSWASPSVFPKSRLRAARSFCTVEISFLNAPQAHACCFVSPAGRLQERDLLPFSPARTCKTLVSESRLRISKALSPEAVVIPPVTSLLHAFPAIHRRPPIRGCLRRCSSLWKST
jgi:hypothetical protein